MVNSRVVSYGAKVALAWLLGTSLLVAQTTKSRLLKICVAGNAAPEVKRDAKRIYDAVSSSPLLSLLGANGVETEDSIALSSMDIGARAYHHLILVGLPSDPMINAAWQREAKVEDGGFYIFGFGHLRGTIGYIESDRNPFLHSQAIASAPYETEVITITGSSPAGIDLAVDAFLQGGLINGVVAAPGWTRPSPTLLDRNPLTLPLDAFPDAPQTAGDAIRVGVTQAGENEYRDEFQDTGLMPTSIVRVKYSSPGLWGKAAQQEFSSSVEYQNGLHRRAIGETLWVAQFATAGEAAEAAAKIAQSAHLQKEGSGWIGNGPSSNSIADLISPTEKLKMQLAVWSSGNKVMMSDVAGLSYRMH